MRKEILTVWERIKVKIKNSPNPTEQRLINIAAAANDYLDGSSNSEIFKKGLVTEKDWSQLREPYPQIRTTLINFADISIRNEVLERANTFLREEWSEAESAKQLKKMGWDSD